MLVASHVLLLLGEAPRDLPPFPTIGGHPRGVAEVTVSPFCCQLVDLSCIISITHDGKKINILLRYNRKTIIFHSYKPKTKQRKALVFSLKRKGTFSSVNHKSLTDKTI